MNGVKLTNGDTPCKSNLPLIKRLEAVSFRSWPAGSTYFEGSWALRLTKDHPAKRLNSANPLDPSDCMNLEARLERSAEKFKAIGRPFIIRQTPLASQKLIALLDSQGWKAYDQSMVMCVDLENISLSSALDQLPLRDQEHWIDQSIALGANSINVKAGLHTLMESIGGSIGLFLSETPDGRPQSIAMCVHDKDMAGLFETATNQTQQNQGFGRKIVETALLWARRQGAKTAWLQVQCDNQAGIHLYKSIGFREIYRYIYRQK